MTTKNDVHKIIVIGAPQPRLHFVQSLSQLEVAPADDHFLNSEHQHVSLEFGRLDVAEDIVLYIFGIPNDFTWHYAWDSFIEKALGLVVVADTLPTTPEIKAILRGYMQTEKANLVLATSQITPELHSYCQDLDITVALDAIIEYKPDDAPSVRAVIRTLINRVPDSPAIVRLRDKFASLNDH